MVIFGSSISHEVIIDQLDHKTQGSLVKSQNSLVIPTSDLMLGLVCSQSLISVHNWLLQLNLVSPYLKTT